MNYLYACEFVVDLAKAMHDAVFDAINDQENRRYEEDE